MALQSTGVYWIPLYDILEECGFQVYLVNARHTKNLPGRKSDVQESQWLLKLHTYGLLNNSFQPPSKIRTLRTYWRQRLQHVTGAATRRQLFTHSKSVQGAEQVLQNDGERDLGKDHGQRGNRYCSG